MLCAGDGPVIAVDVSGALPPPRERAHAVIRPSLRGVPTMRFRDLESVRRLGREAAREAIASGSLAALAAGHTG